MCLSCTVTEIFSVEYWRDLEICTRGRSTSLIMAPVDRSYRTCYWSTVGIIGAFKLRLGLFKRFIRLREYPILKPILG